MRPLTEELMKQMAEGMARRKEAVAREALVAAMPQGVFAAVCFDEIAFVNERVEFTGLSYRWVCEGVSASPMSVEVLE